MLKKVATIGILALLCFSAAAVGGWFLLKTDNGDPQSAKNTNNDLPTRSVVSQSTPSELPVPIHGKPMSPDEIFRIGETFRHRQEAIERREEELRKQENRLKLVAQDIDSQRKMLEGLLVQVGDQLQKGNTVEQQLLQQKQKLDSKKSEFEQTMEKFRDDRTSLDEGQTANLKKWAGLVANMTEQAAAQHITKMCNDGDVNSAARLLDFMEERDAAKILAEIEPSLLSEISDKYMEIQRIAAKTRRN